MMIYASEAAGGDGIIRKVRIPHLKRQVFVKVAVQLELSLLPELHERSGRNRFWITWGYRIGLEFSVLRRGFQADLSQKVPPIAPAPLDRQPYRRY